MIGEIRRSDAALPAGYAELLEELMTVAEERYDEAAEAVANLPAFFRSPVAVASRVYRGIHDVIRANGYDSIRHRAVTSDIARMSLASARARGSRRSTGVKGLTAYSASVSARRRIAGAPLVETTRPVEARSTRQRSNWRPARRASDPAHRRGLSTILPIAAAMLASYGRVRATGWCAGATCRAR